jgi:K+/H+ antiporter YhaU regulatory subunit KhtT
VIEPSEFSRGAVRVEELIVRAGSQALGKTLQAAGLTEAGGVHPLAVRRSDGTVMVSPDSTLALGEGDLVVVLGGRAELARVADALA